MVALTHSAALLALAFQIEAATIDKRLFGGSSNLGSIFANFFNKPAAPVPAPQPVSSSNNNNNWPSVWGNQQLRPPQGLSIPGVNFPVFSPDNLNPNGPYYNRANDFIPFWINWPGKPSNGGQKVPGLPNGAPKPVGDNSAGNYKGPAWQNKGGNLFPGMGQSDTNGDSMWGKIDCPRLTPGVPPPWSPQPTGGSPSPTKGWTCPTSVNNPAICRDMPDTGRTRTYDFSVAYATIAPDGVKKNALIINNQFPGPLIEANWGDWIQVTVTNNLPATSHQQGEGTAIHWHGFFQQETPWFDGVPSVGQNPIAPGKKVTYKFRADHVGTTWYHSHYSAQYAGGAWGPIVIHGPPSPGACYDEDLGPVMLSDHFHADYYSLVNVTMQGKRALSDNILINGKMNYPCTASVPGCTPNAGVSKFKFTPGKKYRLRLINPSSEATLRFSIDGHDLSVISNDFTPIVPYTTKSVLLGVGQRADVIVTATGKSGDAYYMRATAGNILAQAGCSLISGVTPEGVAAVYYDGADTNKDPVSTSSITTALLNNCLNEPLGVAVPICPVPLDDNSQVETQDITISFGNNGTNFVWMMNGVSFRANFNVNLLDNVINGNQNFDKNWNVYKFDSAAKSSIRIILQSTFFLPHPMHLHGHDFNILATGNGVWDGKITNANNSLTRDTAIMPGSTPAGNGFMVIQFKKDNPGIWPLHCHIAWHVSAGLYVNILEQPSAIKYRIPQAIKQTKTDWEAWQAAGNIVDQIDSGL